jgi:hypothetical protein
MPRVPPYTIGNFKGICGSNDLKIENFRGLL